MVVVAADRTDRAGDGVYRAWKFHGACAFYLFSFLAHAKKLSVQGNGIGHHRWFIDPAPGV
jgi:hypothetical protein